MRCGVSSEASENEDDSAAEDEVADAADDDEATSGAGENGVGGMGSSWAYCDLRSTSPSPPCAMDTNGKSEPTF